MRRPEVLIVYKKSQLQLALEKKNSRIQKLLKRDDASVRPMRAADEAHRRTLDEVEHALKSLRLSFKRVYRARLRPEMCHGRLVVPVGGDGTLLDASHKVHDAPVLGVNSDTARSVGFLCAANANTFGGLLSRVLDDAWQPMPVRRLHGSIDGEPFPFPVLNDVLVAHKNPAATSRYLIEHRAVMEDHKSSGLWASTAAGSTAALASAGGEVLALHDAQCQVLVREPFVADGCALSLRHIRLAPDDEVVVTSKMREGRVYLDGPHESLQLQMGARLVLHGRGAPLMLYATEDMRVRREACRAAPRAPAAQAPQPR